MSDAHVYQAAEDHFIDARRQAFLGDLVALLQGKGNTLVPYHEISRRTAPESEVYRGVQTIPLNRIVGSVNPLIPKPATAYQWLPMEDPAITDRKVKRLRQLMAGIDNVYFSIKSERHSYYQALLSLGDRRVAPAIVAAERNGGHWRAAVAEAGVDADRYVFRDRSQDALLPWDIIDGGMKQGFLRHEFQKGLREEWTLPAKASQGAAALATPAS